PARPDLTVALAGSGRDRERLQRLAAATGAPVRLLGFVPDDDLPALLAAADVFAMPCRTRWGGLEQEGFGIVFVEAAACGVPGVAGATGGSHEAVASGAAGFVVTAVAAGWRRRPSGRWPWPWPPGCSPPAAGCSCGRSSSSPAGAAPRRWSWPRSGS